MAIGCRTEGWHDASDCKFDRVHDFANDFRFVDVAGGTKEVEVRHGVHSFFLSGSDLNLYGAEFRLKGIETISVIFEQS